MKDAKEELRDMIHLQQIRERNAQREYGVTITRMKIPKGAVCNPSIDNWCTYCHADFCGKYKTHMWTKSGIGYGFHAQKKSRRCVKEFPNGKSSQLTLQEVWEDFNE